MGAQLSLDIFVIEDELDACENLRDILELDDHRVAIAATASEAFRAPELRSASVILLDWKLPDASALDLLPRLAEIVPDADIIIVTGFGDFERASSALRAGAADYLIKPVNPETLLASIRRVAHKRWLAREKARSEEMFRTLVQAAPSLIVILRLDLSIVYFSPYAEQVTGFAAEDVVGKNFAELLLQDQPAPVIRAIVDNIASRGEISGKEVQITCRDETRRWLIFNARLLNEVEGLQAILAIGQDVTDQKRATERLVQSERLAAIGEAMTGLAHESRNALQRSQAYLELLASQVEKDPESLELVGKIQVAQNQLHQLYEEVRQYAAPLQVNGVPCDIVELIDETWAHLEHARHGRKARLLWRDTPPEVICPVDRMTIQQVFRNILENSLAACADPAEIRVSCHPLDQRGRQKLEISIRDNGPGLSAEQQIRIFEPFFTTKQRGTGLGMTLAKRIVEAHGGTITARSENGRGTEIVIELPRSV